MHEHSPRIVRLESEEETTAQQLVAHDAPRSARKHRGATIEQIRSNMLAIEDNGRLAGGVQIDDVASGFKSGRS
jgi:hypothetical protein